MRTTKRSVKAIQGKFKPMWREKTLYNVHNQNEDIQEK